MKLLIDRILQDGRSLEGAILKVDKFINHGKRRAERARLP